MLRFDQTTVLFVRACSSSAHGFLLLLALYMSESQLPSPILLEQITEYHPHPTLVLQPLTPKQEVQKKEDVPVWMSTASGGTCQMVSCLLHFQNWGTRGELSRLAIAYPCKVPHQRLGLILLPTQSDIKPRGIQ